MRNNPPGLLGSDTDIFQENAADLRHRVFAKISRLEFALLAFNASLLIAFVWNNAQGYGGFYDFNNFLNVTQDSSAVEYYYAYWMVPLFRVLGKMPFWLSASVWGGANLLGVWWAARVFGNKTWIVLATYQVQYVLFYGQITGIIIGGLGLLWWGIKHERWVVASVGLFISLTKYHVGGPLAFILIAIQGVDFRKWGKLLIIPLVGFALSLVRYPGWPYEILSRLQSNPPQRMGDVTLWRKIGPISLLFLVPPFLISMPKSQKLIAFISGYILAAPYFQQTGLLALFAMPVGLLAWLGNFGYSFIILRWQALQYLSFVPLLIYLVVFLRQGIGIMDSHPHE